METRAVAKYVRVSPQKMRLVTDMIKGKDLLEAQHILEYSQKAAAGILSKLLASAAANAENNNKLRLEDLFIYRIFVDEGPTLPQRYRMRAMGRVGRIYKRTSHITVVLEEREPEKGSGKKRRFAMRRPKREKPEEEMELEEEEMELEELEEEIDGEEEEVSAEDDSAEEEDESVEADASVDEDAEELEEEPSVDAEEGSSSEEGETDQDESLEKGEG